MKLPLALLGSLVFGVLVHGQTGSTTQPAIDPKTGLPVTQKSATDKSKTAPTAKTAPTTKAPSTTKSAADKAKKDAAKKEEPPPKIEGMEIPRGGDKGFIGLQVANGVFKMSFYDAKKKQIEPDVVQAAMRWDPKNKIGSERVILNRDGKVLTSERFIQPPYVFKLFITLFKPPAEGGDPMASESFVVDFNQ